MNKGSSIHYLLILLTPLTFWISHVILETQKGPYYWTANHDPDYAYLLDSLNIVNHQTPGIFQHPGTTAQILGAIVILIAYTIRNGFDSSLEAINVSVLSNPELYLTWIHYTFLATVTIALTGVGFACFWLSRNSLLSVLLQTTPLFMAMSFLTDVSRVTPDFLIFGISQLLVILLTVYLYRPEVERSPLFAIALGIILGLGMATKVTFLPMISFLLLVPGIWRKSLSTVATVITFLIATLPISSQYSRVAEWILSLTIKTGRYGTGASTVVDTSDFIKQFQRTLSSETILTILLGVLMLGWFLTTILAWYGKNQFKLDLTKLYLRRIWLLSGLTILAIWFQIIITAKQTYQERYLVPSFGLAGWVFFLIIQLYLTGILNLRRNDLNASFFSRSAISIALVICISISIHQVHEASQLILSKYEIRHNNIAKVESLIQSEPYKDCILVTSRRASAIRTALHFGQFWAGNYFSQLLEKLYPQTFFFNNSTQGYESFSHPVNLQTISNQGQNCLLYQSNRLAIVRPKFKPTDQLTPIFVDKIEGLYRLQPVKP